MYIEIEKVTINQLEYVETIKFHFTYYRNGKEGKIFFPEVVDKIGIKFMAN